MSEQHGQYGTGGQSGGNGHSPTDKVAESVRKAVNEGIEAVRPTWEEKVAPSVASGAAKAAEWAELARKEADRRAAELNAEDQPSSKILGGALGVGAALLALGAGVVKWVGERSAEASNASHSTTEEAGTPGFSSTPGTEGTAAGASGTAAPYPAPGSASEPTPGTQPASDPFPGQGGPQ